MLIRSIIIREAGTHIEVPNADGTPHTPYSFMPNEKGDHVASVKDKAHIARLLSITEGYEFYAAEPGDEDPTAVPAPKRGRPPKAPALPDDSHLSAADKQVVADEAKAEATFQAEQKAEDPLAPLQATPGA